MSRLDIEHLDKRFGRYQVIQDLSLTVADGEFIVLVGPSGCGKSTLLRIIAGLEDPSGGVIRIDGQNVTRAGPKERGIGMVFQSYALYPHMDARENIGFGLKMARMAHSEIADRISSVSGKLRLTDYLSRKPKALSGGQRQRVAIGRAMTRNPNLFLLDEPLSNLDAALRTSMRAEIARLRDQVASTMIYVTHDQVEAMTLADRIVVLNHGQVEQVGKPMDLYDNPANLFVAGFIGSPAMNFLPGRILNITGTRATVSLSSDFKLDLDLKVSAPQGEHVTLGVRPEHLSIADDEQDGDFTESAEFVELLGSDTFVHFRSRVGPLVIRTDGRRRFSKGDRIPVRLGRARHYLFNQSGGRLA